jgi:hypothetical protein
LKERVFVVTRVSRCYHSLYYIYENPSATIARGVIYESSTFYFGSFLAAATAASLNRDFSSSLSVQMRFVPPLSLVPSHSGTTIGNDAKADDTHS